MSRGVVAVLATGPSMSPELAASLLELPRIVVNDAFRLAPDALALVANDRAWWKANPDAFAFRGRKFSTNPLPRRWIEGVAQSPHAATTTNSGLLAVVVAIEVFAFRSVLLYGFDLGGSHYFGEHKPPLANTRPARFEVFKEQFRKYARHLAATRADVEIRNATPGSALDCFPFAVDASLCRAA